MSCAKSARYHDFVLAVIGFVVYVSCTEMKAGYSRLIKWMSSSSREPQSLSKVVSAAASASASASLFDGT